MAEKTSARKRITKDVNEKVEQFVQNKISVTKNTPKKLKKYIIAVIVILLFASLIYFARSLFIAAIVNGQPLGRIAVIRELEKQGGKKVLGAMIDKILIAQEAKKKNVTVNQKEIDEQIKKIEDNIKQQGLTLDQALQFQGITRKDLAGEIRTQLLLQKIVGTDVAITDKEIEDYLNTNKDRLPSGVDEKTLKKQATEQLKQQKLQQKIQDTLQKLREKAKIISFVKY